MRFVSRALALGVLLLAPGAFAQTAPNTTGAQALFDEAKALMKAGKYDQACPKLEQSQRLDPGGGTLVALALCYEAEGKLGSAWTEWDLALSDARSAHRSDRETLALKHVQDLDKRVPRLRVVVTSKAAGVEVTRDGGVVPSALWGTAVPVDPGQHQFEAHAPGKQPWTMPVQVPAEPILLDVTVPELADAPAPVPVPATAPAPTPPTPPPATSPTPPVSASPPPASPAIERSNPMRTWAFIVGGVGVASLAAGTIFALSASSKWSDAHTVCPQVQCRSSAAVGEANDAGTAADLATVFFTAGGILAATSVVFFLWPSDSEAAPSGRAARWHVAPMLGTVNGLSVGGTL